MFYIWIFFTHLQVISSHRRGSKRILYHLNPDYFFWNLKSKCKLQWFPFCLFKFYQNQPLWKLWNKVQSFLSTLPSFLSSNSYQYQLIHFSLRNKITFCNFLLVLSPRVSFTTKANQTSARFSGQCTWGYLCLWNTLRNL
jgi:hypothetical protein